MLNPDLYDSLLDGAQLTIWVSVLAILWGTVAAVVFGVASLSPFGPVRWFIRVYVEVLRGVSAIILLFWVYYSLPIFGIELTPFQAGVVALGLNLAAYGTEIVRGAVQAVPKGQTEAAIAINLSAGRRTWSVVLPQAALIMLPPYGNLLIEVMKASALVSLVGLPDLMFETQRLRSDVRFDPDLEMLDVFLAAMILYFAISLAFTLLIRLLERYYSRGRRAGQPAGTHRIRTALRAKTGGVR